MSEKKICDNCANSYVGYGESSIHYGLRCNEKDCSVDGNDTCNMYEANAYIGIKKLQAENKKLEAICCKKQREINKLRECVEFYADVKNWFAGYYRTGKIGDNGKLARETLVKCKTTKE